MITTRISEVSTWDYTEHLACKNCARTANLVRVFVKNNRYTTELCYCKKCWEEINNKVNTEWERRTRLGENLTNS